MTQLHAFEIKALDEIGDVIILAIRREAKVRDANVLNLLKLETCPTECL
jgi:hypothetical protein